MNKQEIFDTVVAHLRKQGKKASLVLGDGDFDGVACRYRTSDGLKCAFGCVINDDEYNPSFEGKSVQGVLEQENCPSSLKNRLGITFSPGGVPTGDNFYLLGALQQVHDHFPVESWEEEFRRVAQENNVIYSGAENLRHS